MTFCIPMELRCAGWSSVHKPKTKVDEPKHQISILLLCIQQVQWSSKTIKSKRTWNLYNKTSCLLTWDIRIFRASSQILERSLKLLSVKDFWSLMQRCMRFKRMFVCNWFICASKINSATSKSSLDLKGLHGVESGGESDLGFRDRYSSSENVSVCLSRMLFGWYSIL